MVQFKAGMRFGRLTLRQKTRENPSIHPNLRKQFVMDCDCGNRITSPVYYLVRKPNPKVNCGQCSDLRSLATIYKQEWGIWYMMIRRCTDVRHVAYKHYGGRGISVCEEWADPVTGFEAFLKFMGPRPSPIHTIDRVDNDQGYQPYFEGRRQVKWSTPLEQAQNRRKAVRT